MLNCDPPPLSYSPSARKRDRRSPSGPQPPARCFSTMWNGNASCPAGTGVCVVKIVVRRTSSSASSNDLPSSMYSRMRCRTTKPACPSFRWKTDGVEPERAQDADAADAEDDFLLDAHLAIAAVEAGRELAIPGRVLLEVGVEQIQLRAPEPHAPHRDEHRSIAERHRDDAGLAVGCGCRLDRRVGPVQLFVRLFLPPFGRDVLVEVALRIHEADADERHAEVAGLLAVVAGQHAEAAGVDRQRLVQRELGGEVRDRLRRRRPGTFAPTTCPPRFARRRDRRAPCRTARGSRDRPPPCSSVACGTMRSIRTGLCAVARHSG